MDTIQKDTNHFAGHHMKVCLKASQLRGKSANHGKKEPVTSMNINSLGPPESGKATQARHLVENVTMVSLSTGT